MHYISLDRTFQVLDRNQPLSESRHRYGGIGDKSWAELLLLRRVLIVGVAGAGKTVEMKHQRHRLSALGEVAFFVSLSSVSRSGLRDSLSGAELDSFDVWLAATTPAYFFLDSKDEALNVDQSLREALRRLGIELDAALARAHIFVSTRQVDLSLDSDLKDFRELCPFEGAYRPDETSEDVLLSITQSEEHQSHAQKLNRLGRDGEFVAVQLTSLSPSDQKRYVEHVHPQAADSVNRFLSALANSGLALLAAYPRDLSVFAKYWLAHGHLGEILVMLEAYCNQLICEVRENAATSHSTSVAETRLAVERLAAACVLGGKDGVLSLADQETASSGVAEMSFACADVWPQLQPRDHRSILSRGIFDSLVVGQLRLRRDVREYLAACWLLRVHTGDGAPRKLKKYLLASNGGRDVVLASRASLSMLLAMREPTLLDEVLHRNPMLFLSETLVAGFSEKARIAALEACVAALLRGAELPGRGWGTDAVILRAFAFPDALAKLKVLWGAHADSNESVRVLLLWILCEANGHACADEALTAALHLSWGEQTQQLAIRALHVANDSRATTQFLDALLADVEQARFSDVLVKQTIEWLFPEHLSNAQFLALAPRLAQQIDDDRFSSLSFAQRWAERIELDEAGMQLLVDCVSRIGTQPLDAENSHELPWPADKVLFAFASSLALRWFQAIKEKPASQENTALLLTCAVTLLCLNTQHSSSRGDHDQLLQLINEVPEWKHAVYWQMVGVAKLNDTVCADQSFNFLIDLWPRPHVDWRPTDAQHLFERMQNAAHHGDRKIALKLLFWHHAQSGQNSENVAQIRDALGSAPELHALLDDWTTTRPPSQDMLARQKSTTTWQARATEKKSREQKDLFALRKRLESNAEISAADLTALWEWLSTRAQRAANNNDNPQMVSQWPALCHAFGDVAAKRADSAFRSHWRECTVPQLTIDGRSRDFFVATRIALFGVELEHAATMHSGGLTLTPAEASQALKCAQGECSMPNWLDGLVMNHGDLVRRELGAFVQTRLADANEHYQPIQDLRYRLPKIRDLLAPDLFRWLRTNQRAPDDALDALLLVLSTAHSVDKLELSSFFAERSRAQPAAQLLYFKRLLWLDALRAVRCAAQWTADDESNPLLDWEWLGSLTPGFSDSQKLGFLAGVTEAQKRDAHMTVLHWVLAAVNPEQDQEHPGGSPSKRYYQQQSRNSFLVNLGEIPGMATVTAITALKENPVTVPLHLWMDRMIEARLLRDAEPAPLAARQLIEIEERAAATPKNGQELLDLALELLQDIQHYVRDHPFSIRSLLLKADTELAFQRWIAHELQSRAQGRYTVIREAHVVDEKEPDILLTADAGVSVAIEMKLVDKAHWSVAKLEAGLSQQLVGQYLRHDSCRHGIYVLIRQRKKAWTVAGQRVSFEQLVARLREQAERIEEGSTHGVRVKVLPTIRSY